MSAAKPDIRVARTRAAIRQSFEEIALETPLDKITVKEITDRAGINRKTFYLHYETIEALIAEIEDELVDVYFAQYEETPDAPEDIAGHARRFFLYISGRPAYVERLLCDDTYHRFGENVYAKQMSRYRSVGNPFRWMDDGSKRLVMRHIRSTALSFYRNWVEEGKPCPAADAADLVAELTLNGVRGFMR